MRRFTLYQASKHTNISRYKLEQAISEGHLTIEGGKGNIKCFILFGAVANSACVVPWIFHKPINRLSRYYLH